MSDNQKFLREMRQAHLALHKELDQLETMISPPSSKSPRELANFLAQVKQGVTEHFSLEEEDGYMNNVLQKRPDLDAPIAHLLEEHRKLTRSLDTILMLAQTGQEPTLVRLKIKEWLQSIRHHESEENLLVLDAVNSELGEAD